ncbi:hypothetical protein [Kitasatospora purpeofusca]|uniref:hypothetical protein n=1 Tax=Kitasatospora purpeofusca TaxID=67352 RepID=UPI002A5AD5D1|nr:hypothetical protein [Kitasatospora purpeofusca]MDY0810600.1 hypothetical protein [Kitasatospora purpeofusca]
MAPPSPTAGRVSAQALVYGLGTGSFFTTNAVFFTEVVGLSAAKAGLGMTIAGTLAVTVAVPLGRLADRIGPRTVGAAASLAESVCYFAYPAARGCAAFLAVVITLGAINVAGSAGYGAYSLNLYTGEERIAALAYNRSALNAPDSLAGEPSGGPVVHFLVRSHEPAPEVPADEEPADEVRALRREAARVAAAVLGRAGSLDRPQGYPC